MRRLCLLHLIIAFSPIAMLVALTGCDKKQKASSAPPAAATTPPPPPDPTGRRKPGYALGRVLGQDGKPITASGAAPVLTLRGVSKKEKLIVEYSPKPDSQGNYQQQLEEGVYYGITGELQLPFNGKMYYLALDPVQDNIANQNSADGIVQDFVWKLSGVRPRHEADPANHNNWYGGTVDLLYQFYRSDLKRSVPSPPEETRVVLTLTPISPLADGSPGKVLTFNRVYSHAMPALDNEHLADVPLAVYTISGVELMPDGTKQPLLFKTASAFAESQQLTFEPSPQPVAGLPLDAGQGLRPAAVQFTRLIPATQPSTRPDPSKPDSTKPDPSILIESPH
jgi:hypothetical protein